MSDDKIVRIGVDNSKLEQGMSRAKDQAVDYQKTLNRLTEESRVFSKDELKDIQAKINLIKRLASEEESAARTRISLKQQEISLAEKDLALWKSRRAEESAGLKGSAKSKYDEYTKKEGARRGEDIVEERVKVINARKDFLQDQAQNKKNGKELQQIHETLSKKGPDALPETKMQSFFKRVFGVDIRRQNDSGGSGGGRSGLVRGLSGGIRSAAGGNGAGMLGGGAEAVMSLLGVGGAAAAAVAAAIAASVMASNSFQKGIQGYAVASQTGMGSAQRLALTSRDTSLGMSGEEILQKVTPWIGLAGRNIGVDEGKGLIGLQLSRGFTDQQIGQLVSINRYSGRSTQGTVSDFERYSMAKDKSLIKLPEIMETYLKNVNEILSKSGKVDAIGIQQSVMSVGKSYGVSGIALDKTMEGLNKLGTLSENPMLLNIQQQAYKKLYPGGNPMDMVEKLQNPSENPDLNKAILDMLKTIGGGGLYTHLMMMQMTGGNARVSETLMGKEFKVEPKGVQPKFAEEESMERQRISDATQFTGSINRLNTLLGGALDILNKLTTGAIDMISPADAIKIEGAVSSGTEKALKKVGRQ